MSISIRALRDRRAIVPLLALALVLGVAAALWSPANARRLPIAGNALTLPAGAHVLGPVPAGRPMRLIVALAPRHSAVLDAFARLRSRAASMLSQRPLTAAQFTALFSPSAAAEQSVISYLRGYGLRITRTYSDRLLLDVSGAARQVARAFDVSLVLYRRRGGPVYVANATTPRLPAGVATLVSTVIGLRDDLTPHHVPWPHLRDAAVTRPHLSGAGGVRPRGVSPLPMVPPPGLLTPAQVRAAYDITPIYDQVFTSTTGVSATAAITGTGQTIALYELSPYNPDDIASYDAAFGITASAPINIPVDGGAVDGPQSYATGEATLDIELAQAIAPGARILVYNGPASPSSNDNTGADDTYARIVDDHQAQVLSSSWGQCEQTQQSDQPPDFTLLHTLMAQAVAEGMTVLAASGDNGAYDCLDATNAPDTSKKSVDYPASDPYVIAVGGTTLTLNSDGSMAGEGSWQGSGGGVSGYFARPVWQAGPGVANALSNGERQVPDVALNAGTSYAVWAAGGWQRLIGTSAGPPIWAALLALTNQARYAFASAQGAPTPQPCAVLPGLGDIHAQLYQLGATPGPAPAFHDITSGPGNSFAAPGPGWDYVTGWGSPDAYNLLRALIALPSLSPPVPGPCPTGTPAGSITPTPSTGVTSPTVLPSITGTPGPSRTPAPTRTPRLIARAAPGRIRVGGEVTLQVDGAGGAGRRVTFELRYPGQPPQRVLRLSGPSGGATLHLRVPATLPKGRSIVVWLRVTVQGQSVVGWASFRILPAPATQAHNGGHHNSKPSPPPSLCRPQAGAVGVRGERPCA